MAQQNIYDNEKFFESFKNIRADEINFNDLIETPILLGMMPGLKGKSILDVGCGMGQHAKQYSDMGALSVLGVDISEKIKPHEWEKLPWRWIVERTFAWLNHSRRLSKDYEITTSSEAAMVILSHIPLLSHKICN